MSSLTAAGQPGAAAGGGRRGGDDAEHAETCPHCRSELARLAGIVELARHEDAAERLETPPPQVWDRIAAAVGADQPPVVPDGNGTPAPAARGARNRRGSRARWPRGRLATGLAGLAAGLIIGIGGTAASSCPVRPEPGRHHRRHRGGDVPLAGPRPAVAVAAGQGAAAEPLSLAAAFGVLTFVWQQGHGTTALFSSPATGAVTLWVPLAVFALLFGLSMDYEVFILTRINEEYEQVGDVREAVVRGIGHTGRLVTPAR